MSTKEKTVWITGANSGIGRSITHYFSKQNINCIASARREDVLNKMRDEFVEYKNNITVAPLDVANVDEVIEIGTKLLKNYDVDCLINNAGITSFTSAEEDTFDDINGIIQTNLIGSIAVIKSVLPHFIKRGGGTIINILSVAARTIFRNSSIYSASKAGLMAYTNSLREEVRKDNIKVINVFPGATRTPIWSSQMLTDFANKMMSPEDVAKIIYDVYAIDSNIVAEEIVLRPISGDL